MGAIRAGCAGIKVLLDRMGVLSEAHLEPSVLMSVGFTGPIVDPIH